MTKQFKKLKLMPQMILATLITVFVVAGIAGATTIGTNISTDGSLTVTGTTTIDSGVFYVDTTNDRVGIGTTSPSSNMHLFSSTGLTLQLEGSSAEMKLTSNESSVNNKNMRIGISNGNLFSTVDSDNWSGGQTWFQTTRSDESMQYISFLSGNVGIGTSTPQANLVVRGNSSDDAFAVYDGSDNNDFVVEGSGNVGIGVANPQYRLDVDGDINVANGYSYQFNGNKFLFGSSSLDSLYIGERSGANITSGQDNTFIGYDAGASNTTGSNNTFIGKGAGTSNVSGIGNTFVGLNSGNSAISANNNSFFGYNSGITNTGANNTFVGMGTGWLNTTGNSNTFIGNEAGGTNTTGENNILIGSLVYGLSSTTSNYLNIGNVIHGDLNNGNVGIGTTTPDANLQVFGGDSATSTVEIGGITSNKGACLKLRDSDGAGWSYCTILDGTLSCSQTSCE